MPQYNEHYLLNISIGYEHNYNNCKPNDEKSGIPEEPFVHKGMVAEAQWTFPSQGRFVPLVHNRHGADLLSVAYSLQRNTSFFIRAIEGNYTRKKTIPKAAYV